MILVKLHRNEKDDTYTIESKGHAVDSNGVGHSQICTIVSYLNTLLATVLIEDGIEPTALLIEDGHFLITVKGLGIKDQHLKFYTQGISWLQQAFPESVELQVYYGTQLIDLGYTFEKSNKAITDAFLSKH